MVALVATFNRLFPRTSIVWLVTNQKLEVVLARKPTVEPWGNVGR